MSSEAGSQSGTDASPASQAPAADAGTEPSILDLARQDQATDTSERQGAAGDYTPDADPLAAPVQTGAAPERPDWLPEDSPFWNPEKGVQAEEIHKRMVGLRQKLSGGEGTVPEAPEGYAFRQEDGTEYPADDKGIEWFRKAAHELNITQDAAQGLLAKFAEMARELAPAAQKGPTAAEELAKLGPKGKEVLLMAGAKMDQLRAVGTWNDADLEAGKAWVATGPSAMALAKLLSSYGEQAIHIPPTNGAGAKSRAELHSMMAAEVTEGAHKGRRRYDVDPGYRQLVDGEYLKALGDAPASHAGNFNPAVR